MRRPGLLLACCLIASLPGCRSAVTSAGGPGDDGGDDGRLSRATADLRKNFEEQAARARNELDEAREQVASALEKRLDRPQAALERAREDAAAMRDSVMQARQRAAHALDRGASILSEAARDGSSTAADWARLIQERMMRLEESVNALLEADGEHADS